MKPALQFLAILMFAATSSAATAAQGGGSPQVTPMSLEDALTIAEGKSEQIAIARAGVRRADQEKRRARSERLPQLGGRLLRPHARVRVRGPVRGCRRRGRRRPASRICRSDGRTSGAWACCSRRRSTRAAASRRSSVAAAGQEVDGGSSVGPRNSRARRDPRVLRRRR